MFLPAAKVSSFIKNILESVWVKFRIWTKALNRIVYKVKLLQISSLNLLPNKRFFLITMFLPIHITLALLVQINQIIFLRVRPPIVCFKLLNISFSDLFSIYYNISATQITSISQGIGRKRDHVPSCTLLWNIL